MTRVGGGDQPGEVTGIILLGELIVHGWDLAQGTGLPFEVDPVTLVPLYELIHQTFGPGQDPAARGQAFGPPVPVAPALHQTLSTAGTRSGGRRPEPAPAGPEPHPSPAKMTLSVPGLQPCDSTFKVLRGPNGDK
jgi:hypothetical protein